MIDGVTKLLTDVQNLTPKLPELLVSFVIGYITIRIVATIFAHTLYVLRLPKALVSILVSLLAVILWVILVANLLRLIGLQQIALTISGSLLVVGLAVANGANFLVSDVISGLFLAKDPDFDIGYRLKSGDTEGVIESIDIRKTRIRTDEGILIVVPNSVLDKERWQVIDRPKRRSTKTTEMTELSPEQGEPKHE